VQRPIGRQHFLRIHGAVLRIRPQESYHKGSGGQLVIRIVFEGFEEFELDLGCGSDVLQRHLLPFTPLA
jgi:hypothetical protein